jgi:hypothetical protein
MNICEHYQTENCNNLSKVKNNHLRNSPSFIDVQWFNLSPYSALKAFVEKRGLFYYIAHMTDILLPGNKDQFRVIQLPVRLSNEF